MLEVSEELCEDLPSEECRLVQERHCSTETELECATHMRTVNETKVRHSSSLSLTSAAV